MLIRVQARHLLVLAADLRAADPQVVIEHRTRDPQAIGKSKLSMLVGEERSYENMYS